MPPKTPVPVECSFRSSTRTATSRPLSPLLQLPLHAFTGPLAPAGVPVWNPFLNLREMVLRYLMRPVPVVFLRLAFSDQLSVHPEKFHVSPLSLFPPFVIPFVLSRCHLANPSGEGGKSVHLRVFAAGYPHDAQVLVWLWRERRPHRRQRPWVLLCLFEKCLLVWSFARSVSRGWASWCLPFTETRGSLRCLGS